MGTLGSRMIEEDPKTYHGRDPGELERTISEILNDPATRGAGLAELRRVFKMPVEFKDDSIYESTIKELTGPTQSTSDKSKHIQQGIARIDASKAYLDAVKNYRITKSHPDVEAPGIAEYKQTALQNDITPSEVRDPRVNAVDWPTMLKMQQRNPGSRIVPISKQDTHLERAVSKYAPSGVQLQDANAKALAQLGDLEEYDPKRVEGMPLVTVDTATGRSDPLQQGLTEVAAGIYDPAKPEGQRWFGGWSPWEHLRGPAMDGDTSAVDFVTAPLTSAAKGRGFREYAKEAAPNIAAADPTVDPLGGFPGIVKTTAGAGNWATGKADMVPDALSYAYHRAAQALSEDHPRVSGRGAPVAGGETESSKKHRVAADAAADEVMMAQQAIENDLRNPDVKRFGANVGTAASMVAPTIVEPVVAPAVGAAAKGAAKAGRKALQYGESIAGPALTHFITAGRLLNEHPSMMVVPEGSVAPLESAIRSGASAGEVYERKTYEDMVARAKQATGMTDEELRAADRRIVETFHDPEARKAEVARDPRMAALYEIVQPEAEKNYIKTGKAHPYNPLHPQYGQDISRANKVQENQFRLDAIDDPIRQSIEDQQMVGEAIRPDQLRGVPGMRDDLIERATVDPDWEDEMSNVMWGLQNEGHMARGLDKKLAVETEAVRAPMAQDIADMKTRAYGEAGARKAEGEERVRQLELKGRLASKRVAGAYDKPIADTLAYGTELAKSAREAGAQKLVEAEEQKRLNLLEQRLIAEHRLKEAADVRTLAEWKARKSDIREGLSTYADYEKDRAAAEAASIRGERDVAARSAIEESRMAADALKKQQAEEARRAYGHQDISEAVKQYRTLMDEEIRSGKLNVEEYKQAAKDDLERMRSQHANDVAAPREDYAALAARLKELQKRGPQFSVVPRNARGVNDLIEMYKGSGTMRALENDSIKDKIRAALERGKSTSTIKELENIGAMGGIARTGRRVEESGGLRQRTILRNTLVDDLAVHRAAKPSSWTTPAEYAKAHGLTEKMDNVGAVNVIRRETGEYIPDPAWAKELRANDDVLLRVVPDTEYENLKNFNGRDTRRTVYTIPKSLAPEGIPGDLIIDRRAAQVLHEAANPSDAMKAAHAIKRGVDRVVSMGQWNRIATKANPGFDPRNRTNEIHRTYTHDPAIWEDPTVSSITDEVSHAPIGAGMGRVVTEFPNNPVTGNPYTTGELHELALSQSAMGRGITQESMGLGKDVPQGLFANLGMGDPLGSLTEKAISPFVAYNDAISAAMKKALAPGVSEKYGLEDAIRMRTFFNELKNGVRPSIAGKITRDLMIDFGDQNAAQVLAKSVAPFIKYQSSAPATIAKLALENPRRVARVYDVMHVIQDRDTRKHDNRAINAKYKSFEDAVSGAPMVDDGHGGFRAFRPETIGAEAAGVLGGIGEVLDPNGEKTAASMFGPAWSQAYQTRTGINPARGRNVYGLSDDAWKQLKFEQENATNPLAYIDPEMNMANLLYAKQMREAQGGRSVQYMGEHPEAALIWRLANTMPAASRLVGAAPYQLAARTYLGGSNPASRSEENIDQMMQRALTAYLTGLRSSTIDPNQEANRSNRATAKRLPKAVLQSNKSATRKGQTVENP